VLRQNVAGRVIAVRSLLKSPEGVFVSEQAWSCHGRYGAGIVVEPAEDCLARPDAKGVSLPAATTLNFETLFCFRRKVVEV
jgi:hypothetical protein